MQISSNSPRSSRVSVRPRMLLTMILPTCFKAVRSLCGVRFVPLHDHETMPVCPDCTKLYESL
ncbi:DUF3039 domain-containing protein [Corynebacterium sp. 20_84]